MAGKSTYIRQDASSSSWRRWAVSCRPVPPGDRVVDRVFTSVGAGVDIARGRSTSCRDAGNANILNKTPPPAVIVLANRPPAPPPSTAFHAWSVAEYLHNTPK
jgi:DNA mismatch repair ATPase MutS